MVLGNGNASEKSKKWVHPADSLVNGRVTYIIKFLGMAEVPEPRGMPMVKMALKKLSFTRHIKRTEGTKPPKVELGINIHSVSLSDAKTKEALHNIALHRVSYCAEDKGDKRLFAFIAKLDDNKHYCFGLDSLHQANDITVTIGQAFDLAYEKFLKENPPTKSTQKLTDMSKRIEELESENNKLRKRIAELEAASSKNGSATVTPGRAANVPVEPNPVLPSFNFDTKSMASRRQSSPGFTTVTTPETITNHSSKPLISDSGFSSFSAHSTRPTTSIAGTSTHIGQLVTVDNEEMYSTPTRITNPPVMQPIHSQYPRPGPTDAPKSTPRYVNSTVKRFRNTLRRNKRSEIASEEKMKRTISSLFPPNLLSKKLKTGNKNETEGNFVPLEDSPASTCSSAESGTYANIDDVIATLQKMMNRKGDKRSNSSRHQQNHALTANFIGEKLATHHSSFHPNYDTLPKRSTRSSKIVKQNERLSQRGDLRSSGDNSMRLENKLKAGYMRKEAVNSNDDLSSLSTTTTDSSSRECVYVLQSSKPDGTSLHKKPQILERLSKSSARGSKKTLSGSDNLACGTNVDKTLHHLGGEEGYMVLSGRQQVQDILQNAKQDYRVDSTYDNVNRLMEAVREAAAKDAAAGGGDAKKILLTPTSVAPIIRKPSKPAVSDTKHSRTLSWASCTKPMSYETHSNLTKLRMPSTSSISTNYSTLSLSSYADTVYIDKKDDTSLLALSNDQLSKGKHPEVSAQQYLLKQPYKYQFDILNSQETDILHSQDCMSPQHSSAMERTSQDAFNMQPFVPKLPPPSSKSPIQNPNNQMPVNPFNSIQSPLKTSKDIMDMQSPSEASSDSPLKGKKSNYHVISHPLIRKKHKHDSKFALKWSKKYFPNGKKKFSKTGLPGAKMSSASQNTNDAFSKGLVTSEDNLTLDSFDPLKY